jgi:hypothetical protein
MRDLTIAGMRVAYIHSHITSVQAASATTGASIGFGLVIGVLQRDGDC